MKNFYLATQGNIYIQVAIFIQTHPPSFENIKHKNIIHLQL